MNKKTCISGMIVFAVMAFNCSAFAQNVKSRTHFSAACQPSRIGTAGLAKYFCESQYIFDFSSENTECACIKTQMDNLLDDELFKRICALTDRKYFQCTIDGCETGSRTDDDLKFTLKTMIRSCVKNK